MRIALISDIHGNLVSLETILRDIEQSEVDDIICLGDVATIGPHPLEVIQRLKGIGCDCVMGNHDAFLLNPELGREYMDAPWFVSNLRWVHDQLSESHHDYLATFKPFVRRSLDGECSLLCFHGSPESNLDIILSTTPAEVLDEILSSHTATVMAGGHTHVQMMRQHKGVMLVNVGSVGLPFEQMPFEGNPKIMPWAEYSIVDWHAGKLSVELRRLTVDIDHLVQTAMATELPGVSGWISNWY